MESNRLTFAKMERAMKDWKQARLVHGGLSKDHQTFHSCALWFIEYLKTLPAFQAG